jgi:hypothetical protein
MKTLFFILLLFVSNVVISQCDLYIEDIMVSSVNKGETKKYALLNNMHCKSKFKSYLFDTQIIEGYSIVLQRSVDD